MNKIIFVTSGKGGTGKSTFALNLGATYALMGHNTLVIDMNTGMRTLDLLIGAENHAIYSFGDVVQGICTMDDAVIHCDTVRGLDIVVATFDSSEFYGEHTINRIIAGVADRYDYIILDGGPGIDVRTDILSDVADETIIVLTPDNASIRMAEAVDARLIKNKVLNRKCILNRVDVELAQNDVEPDVQEVTRRIGAELVGVILDDVNIRIASSIGIPAVLMRDTYMASNFNKIAEQLK